MQEQPIKVLLVDDDEDDCLMFKDVLKDIGHPKLNLKWASSYEQGKEFLFQSQFDVCFLDYRLGIRTGLDLLREAISLGCKVPIILLTGYGEHQVDIQAMKVGAADYLIKDQISPFLIERSIRYAIHRAQAMESLRQSEECFRSLLDATFEGIFVHDYQGKILDVNQSALKIFGCHADQMIGAELLHFFADEDRSALLKLIASHGETTSELTGMRGDGNPIHLEVSSKTYHHRGSDVRLTAVRDISVRKLLEAQILMQDRLASVGLLASSLAHEIGTPLGVIRGRAEYLGLLTQDLDVKKNVEIISSQIDRVSKLIRSLLNLARGDEIRHGREILLNQVVSDVIDLAAHEFKRHSIEIHNEITDSIPITVSAEAEPLHQVLLNLIVNSVHAIDSAVKDQGRTTGHFVKIRAQNMGENWALSVQDSGCGISKMNLKNLFKPFFTTKDIGVGTGLGLATSYRIVETWGGAIQVESTEGVGTEFRLILPKNSKA